MAERNPPSWLQAGSHPADLDRALIASIFEVEGVLDLAGGALEVTEQATAAMGVTVAAGDAIIDGDESVAQGRYHVVNDADVDLAVAASDPTNPRVDLVVAQVRDSFYSGADDDWQLAVVTGTPAASPAEPAVPDNAHVLARVDVGAAVSSITNANITDRRAQARLSEPLSATASGSQQSLTNDTASATSTWENWGTETITLSNPGRAVVIHAQGDGEMVGDGGTAERLGRMRVQVSIDGGSTWTSGSSANSSTNRSTGGVRAQQMSCFLVASGTPTGDVVVRAQFQQGLGTAGDVTFGNGFIGVTMHNG